MVVSKVAVLDMFYCLQFLTRMTQFTLALQRAILSCGPQNENASKTCCNTIMEPWHEISNNVVCVTSKDSDHPAHTRSPIRAFASRLNILRVLS